MSNANEKAGVLDDLRAKVDHKNPYARRRVYIDCDDDQVTIRDVGPCNYTTRRIFAFIFITLFIAATWITAFRLEKGKILVASPLLSEKGKSLDFLPKISAVHQNPTTEHNRVLVIYSYHETQTTLQNALFFIRHGVHDNADYIFVLNGKSPILESKLSRKDNIKIVHRLAGCLGYGAYKAALNAMNIPEILPDGKSTRERSIEHYEKFIMLDDSVRGPFVPTWADDTWTDLYTKKINKRVKLQGMSYHCYNQETFLHPSILATDRIGLDIFLRENSLRCYGTKEEVISTEPKFTQEIRKAGYGVSTFSMGLYGQRERPHTIGKFCLGSDMNQKAKSSPYDAFFVQVVNNEDLDRYEKQTRWQDDMGAPVFYKRSIKSNF